MNGEDESADRRSEAAAKTRKDERFERQARALRENLRRRNQQRRDGTPPPDESGK